MSEIDKGSVEVGFTLQVLCGPEARITEVPKWGDKIMVVDMAKELSSQDFAMVTAKTIGTAFLETYLVALGHERDSSGYGLAKKRIKISIEDV